MNDALLVLPPLLVTVIGPVTPVVGTVTVSWVALFVLTVPVAVGLPNVTFVTAPKVFPVIATVAPAGAPAGMPSIVGRTGSVAVLVPPGVMTLSVPVVAVSGRLPLVVIEVDVFVPMGRTVEPSSSDVAPVRFVPATVSGLPTCTGAGAASFGSGLNCVASWVGSGSEL